MGAQEEAPPMPEISLAIARAELQISLCSAGNWLQALEGMSSTSHFGFLTSAASSLTMCRRTTCCWTVTNRAAGMP
jgi:hypothetical protein